MNAHPGLFAAFAPVRIPKVLRPYQSEAIVMVRAEVAAGKRRIVLALPTGGGKTEIAAAICQGALGKGNRAAFTVPMLSLVNQTVARFEGAGIDDIGVFQGDHPLTNRRALMQIGTVQTLRSWIAKGRAFPTPRVLIVDEVHVRDQALQALLRTPEWADVIVVGLSATPWSKGMARDWECLLSPVTMADLIRDGYLAPYRVFAPYKPDLSGVKTRAGDYAEDELAAIMGDGKLVADIVETWVALGEGRPTLCFAVDRAHADKIAREFAAAGISAEYADAETPADERDAIGERLRTGATKVVCNVGIFSTGTDWPWVSCLILARPSKSHALFVQQVGRGLRIHPGKDHAIVLDHASNTLNLGFPDAIHFEELDDGEGKGAPQPRQVSKDKRPRECPRCKAVRPAGEWKCANCGTERVRESKIQCEDGELFEVDRKAGPKGFTHDQKQRFWSELQGYARERGKNGKWVLAQYRQRMGVWPRGLADNPIEPTPETIGWLKSRQIAWAKSKARAA